MPRPSIFWHYFKPILFIIVSFIIAAIIAIPQYVKSSAIEEATQQGLVLAERLKILRGYYTENVVNKVVSNSQIAASFDHLGKAKTIPLPATMIHDLSGFFSKDKLSIRLYSMFPFPNRVERKLDDFELTGWRELSSNKDKVSILVEEIDGAINVRTAIADTMTRQACVDCHNAHPDTPKSDWKLEDVRGVLEVTQNINSAIESGKLLSYRIVFGLTLLLIFMGVVIFVIAHKIHSQLVKTNELNQLLNEKNDRLSNANQQLVEINQHLIETEKMSSLGSLVAGVTHEINTPIGVCVTATSAMIERLVDIQSKLDDKKLTENRLKEYFEQSDEAYQILTSNLERAIELLRSFKEVAVEQSADEKHLIDFHKYLKSIVKSLKPEYMKGNHKIEITSEGTWMINTYPGSWAQIVTNLVTNSIMHGFGDKEGGNIKIAAELSGLFLVLKYEDNGSGMSEEVMSRLFKPFYTTKRGQGGSGLGMHLIQNIVSFKFNGEITCNSTAGKGSQFVIKVPIEPNN